MVSTLVLLLPLVSAALIVLVLQKSAVLSSLLSVGSSLACLAMSFLLLRGPDSVLPLFTWLNIGDFTVPIALQINALSKSMLFVVTFIGALVHVFSLGYMKEDAGKARFFAGLSLFMFSMTGIVLAANLVMMFIFWELVGVSSYILIGHWYEKNSAADAAKKAFLTNRIGDFGFMIGILLVWSITGEISFDGLQAWFGNAASVAAAAPALLTAATLCIFCGAVGKSAQFPLHVWLPDAMEGPTPVSALIHAATMVAAGVYMMVKVGFLIAASSCAASVIAWTGGITALLAALMATQQNDIKRILAYSTLSQLGYMVMAVGLNAGAAGYFHLFTHAFFKALLFLGSGAVIYACHHEQDIWKMGGLKGKMKLTTLCFALATAALIAVPGTAGFFSKESILTAAYEGEHRSLFLFAIAGFSALLTAFYMTRLFVVAFLGKPRDHGAEHAHEAPPVMLLPLLLLAAPSIIAGFPFFSEFFSVPPLHGAENHGLIHVGVPFFVSLISLAVGVGSAWVIYSDKNADPVRIPLFANKFYFDEIYAKLIKICQDGIAALLNVLDKIFIDGLGVRGSSLAAGGLGQLFRRLQGGNLQGYTFLFGIGVLLLVFFALAR
ncbi:MAG: NADH-quinone oxidoreductase subunit L [Verrucomicrobiales bacterium]|nr:NADH-quinone oxidoreductase subunit L [Verrucomicrobiales bacterium]